MSHEDADNRRWMSLAETTVACHVVHRSHIQGLWMPVPHPGISDKLYVVTAGHGTLCVQGKIYDMRPGRVFLLPAGAMQRGEIASTEGFRKLWIHFDLLTAGGLSVLRRNTPGYCFEGKTGEEITDLCRRIETAWQGGTVADMLSAQAAILLAVAAAYRAPVGDVVPPDRHDPTFPSAGSRPRDVHYDAIKAAVDEMTHQFAEPITLENIADRIGLSPSYFSELFSQMVGLPPKRFLEMIRMRHAHRLLIGSEQTIAQVAARSGYSDPNYFSRAFQRYFGTAPSAYREMNRQPNSEENPEICR